MYYKIFSEINNIPRPSHHEERIADFLCHFAESHGLTWRRDGENCTVIEKPATPGYEDHEPVVILNHCDMVCVAEQGRRFNALTDPIKQVIKTDSDGERWMYADGTSLGADNGIGLSMALAILADNTLCHPRLEVLTTTNEEDGMSGAMAMSSDFIKGRRVLNLDSEAYDEITTGAAGAFMQKATMPWRRIAMPKGYTAYDVVISGGKGGHSGVDITKGRGNAIKILANLLLVAVRQRDIKLYIATIDGGDAAASIPGMAQAKIVIPDTDVENFETLVTQCDEALERQYAETDPEMQADCQRGVWRGPVADEETTHLLLASINGIPTGPTAMLDETTAQTSNNIGTLRLEDNTIVMTTHTRSFDNEAMENLAGQIARILEVSGAHVETVMKAPAWKEDEDNETVNLACQTFNDVLGFTPRKVNMHFVLEAGFLVEKFPGLHIASIGPRIIEPHSTNEHVQMSTIDNIWKVVVEMLRRM